MLGLLYLNESYVDSVDAYFGVQALSNGWMFVPMQSEHDSVFGTWSCPTEPVFYDGAQDRPLSDRLPLYHGSFSNPVARGSAVYYWGFDGDRIYAVSYDFDESTADTTFLAEDANLLATGNRYQFLPPQFSDSVIPYETWPGRLFVLSGELAVVADSQVER